MSFLLTGDSRLITSSYDDMIIVWDFDTGSIIQRISIRISGAQVHSIAFKNEMVFAGSYDMKVRQIDLTAGRVVKTLDIFAPVQQVITGDDVLYLATRSAPFVIKVSMVDGRQLMSYVGHTETPFSVILYEDLLFSGSADYSILCWKENSGQLVQSFLGHTDLVFVVAVYDGFLYSAGTEAIIIKWSLNDGQILKRFPKLHSDAISCFAQSSQKLYTGSFDSSIVVWNLTSAEPTNSFKDKVNNLNALAIWKNYIFSGGADGQIRLWNQLLEHNEAYLTLYSSINKVFCLHVHQNILYSGSSDQTVLRWNLATLSLLESLESPSRGILSIMSDQSFIFAGGFSTAIYKWNISSGILTGSFSGHSNLIRSLICGPEILISGSSDRSVRIWNLNTQTNDKVFETFFGITGLVLNEDRIVACTYVGLEEFSLSLGEKTLFFQDIMACLSIAFNGRQYFSGHGDATIRIRDLSTLAIIDTYRSHTDYVTSLCFDDTFTLYSASNDGSVKKWNMAARRVAF
ncbi:hypothetical protein MP638_004026, partial [Amoeboaphelidium occidentale]